MLYDCWKMCVIMGAICSAVSLRTLAGSSSGPVALFWLRFFNCLIIPFVPISRGGMLEYTGGSITGMGYLSLVNTEVNWLLRAFSLSRSFVIGLSSTLKALPHVTISSTISSTFHLRRWNIVDIVDDEPATRNDNVNDADVK